MIIEEFKNMKIAYVRRTGGYGSENQKLMMGNMLYLKSPIKKQYNSILERHSQINHWFIHR